MIIFECKLQDDLTAKDLEPPAHSVSMSSFGKLGTADEKIGIVRVGTKVRYRSALPLHSYPITFDAIRSDRHPYNQPPVSEQLLANYFASVDELSFLHLLLHLPSLAHPRTHVTHPHTHAPCRATRRGLSRQASRRRTNTVTSRRPLQRSVSFNVFLPKEDEGMETKMTWSKPVLLILDRLKATLSWYSFDKSGQKKKTCLETIRLKDANVRRSKQTEERQRPRVRSERRSEVRDDFRRGGFVVSNLKTGRMTYFCVCPLGDDERHTTQNIVKNLKVMIPILI